MKRTKRVAAVPLSDESRAKVVLRLKTARGHVEGILGMIDADAHCIDLLRQLFAVRAALEGISHLIVQHHLEQCFTELVRSDEEREAVADLLSTLAYDSRFL
jgi:DNA-binding FrmR family transcriptional regulator